MLSDNFLMLSKLELLEFEYALVLCNKVLYFDTTTLSFIATITSDFGSYMK